MTAPATLTGADVVRAFTANLAPHMAAGAVHFYLAPGWAHYFTSAAVRMITAGEAPGDAPAALSPVSPVLRRVRRYLADREAGALDSFSMYATAYSWPAWDRQNPGAVAAECGWTDYVDAAAIRTLTRGEAAA